MLKDKVDFELNLCGGGTLPIRFQNLLMNMD